MKTLLSDMLSSAIIAGFLQNIIFTGGFGLTESIRMATKPDKLTRSTGFVALFSVCVTVLCRLLDYIPAIQNSSFVVHAMLFTGALALVYAIVFIVLLLLRTTPLTRKRMSAAALNTLILSLPLISYQSAFSMAQAIGTAVGAAVAYLFAVILMHLGLQKLANNDSIPEIFKGNAAVFIYAAILSLALTGITGSRISL